MQNVNQQLQGRQCFTDGCLESENTDEFTYLSPIRSKQNLDTWGLGSTVTWDMESMTFKSISAWQRQEVSSNQDFSFLRANVGNVISPEEQQDQVSQEFNLSGTAMGGAFAWTTGLYGFYEKTAPARTLTKVGFDVCQNQLVNVPGMPGVQVPFSQIPGIGAATIAAVCDATFFQRSAITTKALAAYGQFTYTVLDGLRLTMGLRRSVEAKEYKQTQERFQTAGDLTNPIPQNRLFQTNQSARFDKWTPLFNMSYDLTETSMVYATYSRGFKSGGFNGRPSQTVGSTLEPFDQDILDNYEVGFKSSWLDSRLIANLALFTSKYDDIQQTILTQNPDNGAFASRTVNAAKADIRGAEVELRAVPVAGLDLRAGLGFTDAEYDEYIDFVQGPLVNGVRASVPLDRTDQEFFNTPMFTMNLSAAYTLYDLPFGNLTTRLNWYHQDEVNYGPASDTLEQGKYGLLSGRISVLLPDGKTEIALFGENLLNRRFINSGINFEDGFAVSLGYYGAPRFYGVEIRRQF
jgi:iron complex outermembrane receptor protein